MADEVIADGGKYNFAAAAKGLAHTRMLVITSNDGMAGMSDGLVKMLRAEGNAGVMVEHADTDHAYSDHRIWLETQIIEWLEKLR